MTLYQHIRHQWKWVTDPMYRNLYRDRDKLMDNYHKALEHLNPNDDYVDLVDVWRGKENDDGTFIAHELVSRHANGKSLRVGQGYAVETVRMTQTEFDNVYGKNKRTT